MGDIELDISRSYRIYDTRKSNLCIQVIGAGSTGSFIALTLAKMGIKNIKVIDYDKVENHNISNQFYRYSDIGKFKVDALKEIIKDFTGTEIEVENIKIEDDYDFDVNLNSIVILCVDSIEARKLILEQLWDYPVKIIDTRFGSLGFSVHVADLSNDEEKEVLKKSLDGEIVDTPCGMKTVLYSVLGLSSEVCSIVKKCDLKEPFPTILRREMSQYRFISDINKVIAKNE